jgi:hypothetical protein
MELRRLQKHVDLAVNFSFNTKRKKIFNFLKLVQKNTKISIIFAKIHLNCENNE